MHTHMHTHMHTQMHMHVRMQTHIRMCMCMYLRVHLQWFCCRLTLAMSRSFWPGTTRDFLD
jgi:hypothetical protein